MMFDFYIDGVMSSLDANWASLCVWQGMNQTQISLLDQAYNALVESTYDALIPQTRLKPYLDSMGLSFTNGSLNMDFTANDELILKVAA